MTINEVARLAGVSKATVSRVLNDSEKVKPETKEKILKIIREYNYEPSMLAQGLSRNENSTIGVIIPEIDNEFFGEILAGINEVVDLHNLSMICCDTNNNVEREKKALRVLAQQKVRGVIITPATEKCDSLRKALLDLDVPVVVLDRDVPNSRWDGVYYDNVNSAYAATMALIREGYTKIGVITGDMELQIGRERFEGYRMALEDERLELSKAFVKYGDFSVSTAYEISKKMFCSGEMPQAILTSNNRTTLGFLKAARECDVKVGKEIALIGIDHIGILEDLGFPFSCVSRDSRQMGREAINVLLERLNGTITIGRKVSVMPYKLELRGSEKRTTDFFGFRG